MLKNRTVFSVCLLVGLSIAAMSVSSIAAHPAQVSASDQRIWSLEHDYWRYVQDNNLAAYLTLWHKDFIGWPSVSPTPVHKDHITDWITSQTSKGLTFKTMEFKPASIQLTGDLAITYYWISYAWQDKAGQGATHTFRITHSWMKIGNDWQILGGMSMPEASPQM
ncbi:MAG TPA: nuclear transport factor 2 family protein [Candidatus Limnocylindrales bacterium]|nr:nuclear transport factor 2 family protein [Candidatus Limnocylindrales bacterium]